MDDIGDRSFREEANARPWSALMEGRKEAFCELVRFLAAATPEDRPDFEKVSPDGPRQSRVIFVSGRRGSGKTTLLLSVRQQCQRANAVDVALTREKERVAAQIKVHAPSLIWLEALDLDPMPETVNLLAAVLARVQGVMSRPASRTAAQRSFVEPEDERERILGELQDLRTAVAMAWEGNVPQRAANVDPSTYAVEVGLVEDARLGLNARLQHVLAKVAGQVQGHNGKSVFVLPVDDFDLNPRRSVELLRLARALTVPNLVFIFLGDIALAEEMLYYDMCGMVARLSRSESSGDRTRLEARVSELASSVMRKLIPPAQRIALEDAAGQDEAVLRRLSTSGLTVGGEPLWNWLRRKHAFDGTNAPFCYQGVEILDASPRQLVDLDAILAKVADSKESLGALTRLLRMELHEDPAVSFEAARDVDHAFLPRAGREVGALDTSPFRRRLRMTTPVTFARDSAPFGTIEARVPLREELSFKDPSGKSIPLGRRSTAYFMVLHDLHAAVDAESVIGRLRRVGASNLACARWFVDGCVDPVEVRWPLPFQHSFRDFQYFCRGWQLGVEQCANVQRATSLLKGHQLIEWLASWWILAGLVALPSVWVVERAALNEMRNAPTSATKTEAKPNWSVLIDAIKVVVDNVEKRRNCGQEGEELRRVEDWLVDLMLLACPEVGADGWRDQAVNAASDPLLTSCFVRLADTCHRRRARCFQRLLKRYSRDTAVLSRVDLWTKKNSSTEATSPAWSCLPDHFRKALGILVS